MPCGIRSALCRQEALEKKRLEEIARREELAVRFGNDLQGKVVSPSRFSAGWLG
jgi:hypothetical protein